MIIKKLKYIIFFTNFFLLVNCKNAAQNSLDKTIVSKNNWQNVDFDNILKCSGYSFNDKYFTTADYGCIYKPNGKNNFGNLVIYLLPKKEISIKDEDIERETKRVNNLSIDSMKNEFSLYIYVIGSEYLHFNKIGDPTYYQNEHYVERLYKYGFKKDWLFIDSIEIFKSKENIKEQNWRDGFINNESIKVIQNSTIKSSIDLNENNFSKKWIGTYSLKCSYGKIGNIDANLKFQIKITSDSIIATGDGYQISFKDLLIAKEKNNTLVLSHFKNLDGNGMGKRMTPEFTINENFEKYYLNTKWIDSDVITKPQNLGYEMKKLQ